MSTEESFMHILNEDETEEVVPRHQLFDDMLRRIETVDAHCKNRGDMGGLDWGSELLNQAFEGVNTGVHLIAGQSNIGKSSYCLQLAWQIAKSNMYIDNNHKHKAYVLYFSLDDNDTDLMPRVVATEQKIPINCVRSPKKYADNPKYMRLREEGIEKLRNMTHHFKMLDGKDGTTLEFITSEVKKHIDILATIDKDYKVVVFIDNFYDIDLANGMFQSDVNAKFEYISEELDKFCTINDVPIICTAEYRKLNGFRRPTLDDLKSNNKIVYKAKVVMLCYNEVAVKSEASDIYFLRSDSGAIQGEKQPIFEVKVGKNKFESFKGRIYYEMFNERAYLKEVKPEEAKKYSNFITG